MLDPIKYKQRRHQKLSSVLFNIVSTLLSERDLLLLPSGTIVTPTHVQISDNLKSAHVFCSCFGPEPDLALEKIREQTKYLQKQICKKKLLKTCPLLFFHADNLPPNINGL